MSQSCPQCLLVDRFEEKCSCRNLTEYSSHVLCLQLRDYLQKSLYDPHEGYFTSSKGVLPVGSIGQPLQFSKLLGQADYLAAVKQRYNELQVGVHLHQSIFVIAII